MSATTEAIASRTLGTRVRPWHEAVIDMWLAEPGLTQREIAKRLGKSEYWLSVLTNSDAFKVLYRKRAEDVVDPLLTASVEDRLTAVVGRAADELARRLETAPGALSTREVTQIVSVGARGLGMGATNAPSLQQNLYVIPSPGPAPTVQEWKERARQTITDVVPL